MISANRRKLKFWINRSLISAKRKRKTNAGGTKTIELRTGDICDISSDQGHRNVRKVGGTLTIFNSFSSMQLYRAITGFVRKKNRTGNYHSPVAELLRLWWWLVQHFKRRFLVARCFLICGMWCNRVYKYNCVMQLIFSEWNATLWLQPVGSYHYSLLYQWSQRYSLCGSVSRCLSKVNSHWIGRTKFAPLHL